MDTTRDSTAGVDDRVSPPVTVPTLWVLLALSLIVFQYKTMAKFGVLPPGRSFAGPLRYYQAVAERVAFDFSTAYFWRWCSSPEWRLSGLRSMVAD